HGFFFQAEDGIRDGHVTGVQTCALPISWRDLTEIFFRYTAAIGLTAGGHHLYTLGFFGDVRLFDPDTGEMIGQTSLPADLLRVHCDNVTMNVSYPDKIGRAHV